VSQSLVEPAFFLEAAGSFRQSLSAEGDRVGVFVSDDGPEVRSGFQVGAQVHHVATVTERLAQFEIEIRAANKAIDADLAGRELVQPP
jgi:hypothetical protein